MKYLIKVKDWKKFKTDLKRYQGDLWGYYIDFPGNLKTEYEANNRRVLLSINKLKVLHSGLMRNGKGGYFITLNKATVKELNLKQGDELQR